MSNELDARGLACPAPVLMVKEAVENRSLNDMTVLVDNEASKENVSRFLGTRDFTVTASLEGEVYRINALREGGTAEAAPAPTPPRKIAADQKQRIMVMAAADRMGSGDDELGRKLMVNFIKTLKEVGGELWRLVLVNSGVKLAIDESPVLEDLLAYEKEGLTILVCGTCLSHFDLMEKKSVGETTNMLDIVTAMQLADKVVRV